VGITALILYTINTLISGMLLLVVSVLRIIPLKGAQYAWHKAIEFLIRLWVNINTLIQRVTIPRTQWVIESNFKSLEDVLHPDHWYLLISNHQNWVDILVLQRIFNGYIPFPKFFLKRELLWILPVVSWACWLLNFPLVARYNQKQLAKNPELKTYNLNMTRKACEAYKTFPTTVANFVEGTRFTDSRHKAQGSPYRHLLKPNAGGIALSLDILHHYLDKILNVTICYNPQKMNFWNFLCGDIRRIKVHIEVLPITSKLIGDYQNDRLFRGHIQKWLNDIWIRKDQLIEHYLIQDDES
jgi:1-acyl-sn-glycerol-3-phosphate acyltransferase